MMVIIGVKKDPRIQTSVTKYFPHNYVFTLLGSRKTVGGAFYSWFWNHTSPVSYPKM
jgi:hypothetical protein